MARNGKSYSNGRGGYYNYDDKGKYTGKSVRRANGTYSNYDRNGHYTGSSKPSFGNTYTHYDSKGNKTGHSSGTSHNIRHYDASGKQTGSSHLGGGGSYTHNSGTSACYIATCVYGSYDCPEVWVLRRFRDNVLKKNVFGRSFIRLYYAVSPCVVRTFGKTRFFHHFWRVSLDRLIGYLKKHGTEDTPYCDTNNHI